MKWPPAWPGSMGEPPKQPSSPPHQHPLWHSNPYFEKKLLLNISLCVWEGKNMNIFCVVLIIDLWFCLVTFCSWPEAELDNWWAVCIHKLVSRICLELQCSLLCIVFLLHSIEYTEPREASFWAKKYLPTKWQIWLDLHVAKSCCEYKRFSF